MVSMNDPRIVPCEHCGTEGRIYRGHANDPHPRDCGPCPACEGTGREIIETDSIGMEDIERWEMTPDEHIAYWRKAAETSHTDAALVAFGVSAGLRMDEDLIAALRKLVFAARTSGGTTGRDEYLCVACDEAERS